MGQAAAARLRSRAAQVRTRQNEPVRPLTRQERYEEKQRQRLARSVPDALVWEVLALPQAVSCRCGIHTGITVGELLDLGAGCTTGRWVCPTLDTLRRRLDR